jgi:hypothetical protein
VSFRARRTLGCKTRNKKNYLGEHAMPSSVIKQNGDVTNKNGGEWRYEDIKYGI